MMNRYLIYKANRKKVKMIKLKYFFKFNNNLKNNEV